MMKTVIVSDLHLGASNSRTEDILGLLETDFDRLILNGDTVDHHNFHKFRLDHWQVLTRLRELSQERKLILLRGNHELHWSPHLPEYGPHHLLAHVLNVPLRDEYVLWVGRKRYLVLHGDRFDRTMNLTRLGDVADIFYRGVQKGSLGLARWLKAKMKRWCGVVDMVRTGAITHARAYKCDGVICGHTHYEEDSLDEEGFRYLNSGSWVEQPCTYLECDGSDIHLREWSRPSQPPSSTVLLHDALADTFVDLSAPAPKTARTPSPEGVVVS